MSASAFLQRIPTQPSPGARLIVPEPVINKAGFTFGVFGAKYTGPAKFASPRPRKYLPPPTVTTWRAFPGVPVSLTE